MSNICYIYQGTKLVVALNYGANEFQKEWYPEWEDGMKVYNRKFEHPILNEDGFLREKTREERILQDNTIELLQAGEKVEEGKIVKVEYTEGTFVTPRWNNTSKSWEEGANKETVLLERKDKVLNYKKIQSEIKDLEDLSELFPSPETIELLKSKLEIVKKEIGILTEKIKKLG